MPDQKTMTKDEWMAEGRRRFGENTDEWRFECPVCANVASIGDFRQYKDQGADPSTAYGQCIGRFQEGSKKAFAEPAASKGDGPCDYASFGLFRLGPMKVTFEEDGEAKSMLIFDFADEGPAEKRKRGET